MSDNGSNFKFFLNWMQENPWLTVIIFIIVACILDSLFNK